ncbi:MAG: hypothetical protein ACQGVC_24870 [Myxococcota bacterium]
MYAAIAALLVSLTPATAWSGSNEPLDAAASVIRVETACSTTPDCFETIAEAHAWTWTTRNPAPSASAPLLWEIGPGTWDETWSCPSGGGHVSVRGAGRGVTIISGDPSGSPREAGTAEDCENLDFSKLTFRSEDWGFRWKGTGSSSWKDVGIESVSGGTTSAAWAEVDCSPSPAAKPTHYFFNSRVALFDSAGGAHPAAAWLGGCSDAWFHGGQILAELRDAAVSPAMSAIRLQGDASLRVFGTSVDALATPEAGVQAGVLMGVDAGAAGNRFEMHAGAIRARSQAAGTVHVIGVATSGGHVDTIDTAFVVEPSGAGIATRLSQPAFASPFMWPADTAPPPLTQSVDGQDLFVEIDCASDGNCDAGGYEAHLMVMNPAECGSADPWFDTVTGRCRNVTN